MTMTTMRRLVGATSGQGLLRGVGGLSGLGLGSDALSGLVTGPAPRGLHASAALRHGAKGGSCGGEHDDAMMKAVNEYLTEEEAKEIDASPSLGGTHPDLKDVLAGNKAWVARKNSEDPEFFAKLGATQEPRYLYIGCSDARVDPAQLMGLKYRSLFVHRNVGNVVSATDMNVLTVVDFAVNYLKVPHIVVCGHYDCGAVRGSIARPTDGGLGFVENWLRNIRDVALMHRDELKGIAEDEDRHRRLVELNVMEQCLNIFKLGSVQQRRVKTFSNPDYSHALPRVHGLVFDANNGVLKKLPLDFKDEMDKYRELYELYQLPEWVQRSPSFAGADDASAPPSPAFGESTK